MANVTFAVSETTKQKMDNFGYINWSAVEQKVKELEFFESITQKSELTEVDALALGRKVNKGLATRHSKSNPA
ncbi:hypothetical protein HZB02_03080 [Candidatus Woesearchaeota archaeon]|nr:hypothetical protein [Candidatus Woesearchaeota archaeon]